jgi:multidrug efflux pump subunit AcrA (membrane-fusion protein)
MGNYDHAFLEPGRSSAMIAVCLAWSALSAAPPGLLEVEVARPIFRTVRRQREYEARIEPRATVQLRSRLAGPVERVLHDEGDKVKKGDVLFEIDAKPARIALARAEAMLKLAEAKRKRGAADEVLAAEVAVAKVAVEEARMRVEWATVRSPMDGRVRKRLAEVGTVVKGDDTVLAVIDSTGPVRAVFRVEEDAYLANFRLIKSGKAPAGKDAAVVSVMIGREERKGRIVSVGTQLLPDSDNPPFKWATVTAEVPDGDESLIPGMGVTVLAYLSTPMKVAYVPSSAPYYLVVRDGKLLVRQTEWVPDIPSVSLQGVERASVQVGYRDDDWVVIRAETVKDPDVELPIKIDGTPAVMWKPGKVHEATVGMRVRIRRVSLEVEK